ncbi:hypothetical protein BGZ94_008570 [Podila epigama]|nr:hypothetical protein BGZ94_008570 [Podila epigama]
MSRLLFTLASILLFIQVWMTNPVHAVSFAVCVGAKDVNFFKTVFGFHLWTSDNVQARGYVSSMSNVHSTGLEDKGWKVTPYLDINDAPGYPMGMIRSANIQNKALNINTQKVKT